MSASTNLSDVQSSEVFRFVGQSYLHQDTLSWSRTQLMLTVEAGALAGTVALKASVSSVLLVLATFVLWALFVLILRDWQIRDHHKQKIDEVLARYGIDVRPPARFLAKGERMLWTVTIVLTLVNIVAFVLRVLEATSIGSADIAKFFGPG